MIIYLPPDFDINYSNYSPLSEQDTSARIPQVCITRIHRSPNNTLIVFQIESCSEPSHPENSITRLSSQANPSEIRKLYRELNFKPIDEFPCDLKSVNVFGLLLEMSLKSPTEPNNKYAQLLLFDFDINTPVVIKLWRGISAWITSLSIGCRLQIRNLHFKDNELHSNSNTEICLLAHGNNFINNDIKLSSRAYNLSEKEKEIISFLNHQSLLIKPQTFLKYSSNPKSLVSISVAPPFYLEHIENHWVIQGIFEDSQIISVKFVHIDATIWQQLFEMFIDSSKGTVTNNFIVKFIGLKSDNEHLDSKNFLFTCESSLLTEPSSAIIPSLNGYKSLNWDDLVSLKSIRYGIYAIKGILESTSCGNNTVKSSEESLGNLSLLPDTNHQILILRDPIRPSIFIYPDHVNNCFDYGEGQFLINVRTILNDGGNVNEIIRKSVFIINKKECS